jgi:hypothetical protein
MYLKPQDVVVLLKLLEYGTMLPCGEHDRLAYWEASKATSFLTNRLLKNSCCTGLSMPFRRNAAN